MPRTLAEILEHADELADRFDVHDPDPSDVHDARPLRDVRRAFEDSAIAQARLRDAVVIARAEGCSWAAIGTALGTSGEAARQRYGTEPRPVAKPARRVVAAAAKGAGKSTRTATKRVPRSA